MDNKLTAEENRYLRAAILYFDAHGESHLARLVENATPDKQRVVIGFHHGWLEYGITFAKAFCWLSRIDRVLPLFTVWEWVSQCVRSLFSKKS